MNFPIFNRTLAAFKRVVNGGATQEDAEARRVRLKQSDAECAQVSDQLARLALASSLAAAVRVALQEKAMACRVEIIDHVSIDGDGSVNHVTSLGVHVAGIEVAMREVDAHAARMASTAKKLRARLAVLRLETRRDVRACARTNH